MRRLLPNVVIVLLLVLVIWGHVGELFDHWDHTMQTGNDIEFNLVLVAVAVGAVVACVKLFRPSSRPLALAAHNVGIAAVVPRQDADSTCLFVSPPAPLRI